MKTKLTQISKTIFIATILLIITFVFVAFASADTVFYYTSSPSSWVGNGETVTVTPSDGFDFNVSRNYDQGISFAINDFAHNPDFWSTRWWYLDFAGPMNTPLQVGYYGNATRFPFQNSSDPGLSFIGNGRGNNELTGYFDVLEVGYGGSDNVLSFAADFVQYDEGFQDWWNRGSVRYNSSIPVTVVPEPVSSILFVTGGTLLAGRRYLKRRMKA